MHIGGALQSAHDLPPHDRRGSNTTTAQQYNAPNRKSRLNPKPTTTRQRMGTSERASERTNERTMDGQRHLVYSVDVAASQRSCRRAVMRWRGRANITVCNNERRTTTNGERQTATTSGEPLTVVTRCSWQIVSTQWISLLRTAEWDEHGRWWSTGAYVVDAGAV